MPSPVGHVVAGLAAGWLVAGVPATPLWGAAGLREAVLFAGLAVLPDADLLFGGHRGPTHSIGMTALVGLAAWLLARRAHLRTRASVFGLACGLAYGSHVLLDWLSTDSSPPIGVMALWPFDREYYESSLHIFMAISRRYYQGWTFVAQNARALVRELAILGPALAAVLWLRSRRAEREARRPDRSPERRTSP